MSQKTRHTVNLLEGLLFSLAVVGGSLPPLLC